MHMLALTLTLPIAALAAWTAPEGCPGKSYKEGGCPASRCDKNVNQAKKVCEDANECTVQCCAKKCNTEDSFTCKFYAWEEKAQGIGDCYVFDACQDYGEDDYITYSAEEAGSTLWDGMDCSAMVGGDKPLCDIDFDGGGCEKSRCSKSLNDNVKICDDAHICTVECCAKSCLEHNDFSCAWYSWEPKEGNLGNCYLFKDCQGYDDHEDYTTYRSRDSSTPWTGQSCSVPDAVSPSGAADEGGLGDCSTEEIKKLYEGGCPKTRCDKDSSPNKKVCDDEPPMSECVVKDCEVLCEDDTKCSHFAWELKSPTSQEGNCYIFHGCKPLNPHEDYTTYLRTSDLPTVELSWAASKRAALPLVAVTLLFSL